MRSGGRGSVLLLLLAALVLLRPWEQLDLGDEPPASASAYVTRVVDGDTVEVQLHGEEEDVRYIGVDTPETVKPGAPVDCFGPQASSFNHRLVERRRVRLVFGPERRDQYGRLLAYVYLGDRFVNAELVRRGFARTLFIPPNDRFEGRLKRLEIAAARAGRGLWGAC
ncbi:MAG TPA: thermonuclease family protein [Solirubrobacterales bacterium]